jgi:hypothetical protein
MKQLFTIFLMIQLWATPAYAAFSECVDHLSSFGASSAQADVVDKVGMASHVSHSVEIAASASLSETTCEICLYDLISGETTPSPLSIDEVCSSSEPTEYYGAVQSRDLVTALPLVNSSDSEPTRFDSRRMEPNDQSLVRRKVYLRTSRIRL